MKSLLARKVGLLATALSVAALPQAARGQEASYLSVQYMQATLSADWLPDFKPTVLVLRGGRELAPHISLEGRIGVGIADDERPVYGTPLTLGINKMFGIYVKGALPLGGSSALYAAVGYTTVDVSASVYGVSASDDDSDSSLGLGLDIGIGDGVSLNLEQMRYTDVDGEISGTSLGVTWTF